MKANKLTNIMAHNRTVKERRIHAKSFQRNVVNVWMVDSHNLPIIIIMHHHLRLVSPQYWPWSKSPHRIWQSFMTSSRNNVNPLIVSTFFLVKETNRQEKGLP